MKHFVVSEPIRKSPREWRKILSPTAFSVLRERKDDQPFQPLLFPANTFYFSCGGCHLPMYLVTSRVLAHETTWLMFGQGLRGCLRLRSDISNGRAKHMVECAQCDGFIGRVYVGERRTSTDERHVVNLSALIPRVNDSLIQDFSSFDGALTSHRKM